MSIYSLKPRFQALLRPSVARLDAAGVTANQVTVASCVGSVVLGFGLTFLPVMPGWYALVSLWMFVRMALNAMDGMLAREFGHKSALGAYLNELTDVVSDAALYLPFAKLPPFSGASIGCLIFFAALSEMAGVVAAVTGASRRYDGPMGKSDRAFVFGALALWVALPLPLASWAGFLPWLVAGLTAATAVNRVRRGLAELAALADRPHSGEPTA